MFSIPIGRNRMMSAFVIINIIIVNMIPSHKDSL